MWVESSLNSYLKNKLIYVSIDVFKEFLNRDDSQIKTLRYTKMYNIYLNGVQKRFKKWFTL